VLAGFVLRRDVVRQDDINPNRLDARTTAFRHVTKEEIAHFKLESERLQAPAEIESHCHVF